MHVHAIAASSVFPKFPLPTPTSTGNTVQQQLTFAPHTIHRRIATGEMRRFTGAFIGYSPPPPTPGLMLMSLQYDRHK